MDILYIFNVIVLAIAFIGFWVSNKKKDINNQIFFGVLLIALTISLHSGTKDITIRLEDSNSTIDRFEGNQRRNT